MHLVDVTITDLMLERAGFDQISPPPPPASPVYLHKIPNPESAFFRVLYHFVGHAFGWYEQKKIDDETLNTRLHHSNTQLIIFTHQSSLPNLSSMKAIEQNSLGFAELTLHPPYQVELSFFGLFSHTHGKGLGSTCLYQTLNHGFTLNDHQIQRFILNTCTLDHSRALPLYQSLGFIAQGRRQITIENPHNGQFDFIFPENCKTWPPA